MIYEMIEISEYMVAFNFFKCFHLIYDFPVVLVQFHAVRGLLHNESMYNNSGIANYSQLINGKPSCLLQSLPNGEDFSGVIGSLAQPPGEVYDHFPGVV